MKHSYISKLGLDHSWRCPRLFTLLTLTSLPALVSNLWYFWHWPHFRNCRNFRRGMVSVIHVPLFNFVRSVFFLLRRPSHSHDSCSSALLPLLSPLPPRLPVQTLVLEQEDCCRSLPPTRQQPARATSFLLAGGSMCFVQVDAHACPCG